MKYLSLLFLFLFSCNSVKTESVKSTEKTEDYSLLLGTYTDQSSQGIYTKNSNELKLSTLTSNPSFLCFSNDKNVVYSVNEDSNGGISAFSRSNDSLIFINSVPSLGKHPCHISLDKTNRYLTVANYSSGNFVIYSVKNDGSIDQLIENIQHKGSGPNKQRQEGPHVHSVNFSSDNKQLLVADLGTDFLMIYNFDQNTGQVELSQQIKLAPGSGPRHLVTSKDGNKAYVIQEMGSMISFLQKEDEKWNFIESYSTLPEGFEGENACADIHFSPDEKFIYGSNRFHDSIVVFEKDMSTGKLSLVSHHNCGGKTPRNFGISPDGKNLVVANQDSDNLVYFNRDSVNGKISPVLTDSSKISKPVCVLFYK